MATKPEATDYRAKTITGRRYRRPYRLVIDNPRGGDITIAMDEEEVVEIDGQVKTTPTGTLSMVLNPDATDIVLVDPQSGAATTKKLTQAQFFAALVSLYRALAKARDQANP